MRILTSKTEPFETPMVDPDGLDAPFSMAAGGAHGITSPGLGTITLSSVGVLSLYDAHGSLVAWTLPVMPTADPNSGARHVTFQSSSPHRLFGRGGGPGRDGTTNGCHSSREPSELIGTSPVTPRVENCAAKAQVNDFVVF